MNGKRVLDIIESVLDDMDHLEEVGISRDHVEMVEDHIRKRFEELVQKTTRLVIEEGKLTPLFRLNGGLAFIDHEIHGGDGTDE